MNTSFNYDAFLERLLALKAWIMSNIFVWENLIQILEQVSFLLVAWIVGTIMGRWIRRIILSRRKKRRRKGQIRHGNSGPVPGFAPSHFQHICALAEHSNH